MKLLNNILIGSFVATAAISSTAFAEDSGFYAGMNLGAGKLNLKTPNGEDKSTALVSGVLLGYRFSKYLGVEGQYTGIGKVTDNVRGSAKGDSASLSAIGFLPLNDDFSLYGKLGIAATKTTVSSSLAPMNDATHTSAVYGLGSEYHLTKNVDMRLGWDHYTAAIDTNASKRNVNANVVSIGAVYNF